MTKYKVRRFKTTESASLKLLKRIDNNEIRDNEILEVDEIKAENMLTALSMSNKFISMFLVTNDKAKVIKRYPKDEIYNYLRTNNKAMVAIVKIDKAYIYFRLYQDGYVYRNDTRKPINY